MKQLIEQQNDECYFCHRPAECTHHIFYGTANRKMSEKYGCTVRLCNEHHNLSGSSVHFNKDMDMMLKKECQKAFEEKVGNRDYFRQIFGRSYL